MNKYDDIKTLLYTNIDIKQSCEFLYNYLKNYCLKPYNREKIDAYYNSLPEIFKRFLLIYSSETGIIAGQGSKAFLSLLQALTNKNSSFEDFEIFLNLFLAPLNTENEINLFSSIFTHNYGNTRLLFPLSSRSSSNANTMILSLITTNQVDSLLNEFPLFEILSHSKDEMIKYLQRKEMILTIKEYYIFTILNFIKNSSCANKLSIKDHYPNFKKYFENISPNKFFSRKTEFILNHLDSEYSITYNFYNILFLDFIYYLFFSHNIANYHNLQVLVFAIHFLWLGDYALIPHNYFFSLFSNNQGILNFPNAAAYSANVRDSLLSSAGYSNCGNYITNSLINNLNIGIPNVLVLNCLKNLIMILQAKNFLFSETVINGERICVLKPNVLLFTLQNALYSFFKMGFSKFTKDSNSSEVSLADFASVWFAYITPWESNFNLLINSDYSLHQHNQQSSSAPQFYNKLNKQNVSPNKNIFNVMNLRMRNSQQQINSEIHTNSRDYLEYIELNLHFYTDLFQDYINAFCCWNILSVEELNILLSVVELYDISAEGLFINKVVNYLLLKEFSLGNINVK